MSRRGGQLRAAALADGAVTGDDRFLHRRVEHRHRGRGRVFLDTLPYRGGHYRGIGGGLLQIGEVQRVVGSVRHHDTLLLPHIAQIAGEVVRAHAQRGIVTVTDRAAGHGVQGHLRVVHRHLHRIGGGHRTGLAVRAHRVRDIGDIIRRDIGGNGNAAGYGSVTPLVADAAVRRRLCKRYFEVGSAAQTDGRVGHGNQRHLRFKHRQGCRGRVGLRAAAHRGVGHHPIGVGAADKSVGCLVALGVGQRVAGGVHPLVALRAVHTRGLGREGGRCSGADGLRLNDAQFHRRVVHRDGDRGGLCGTTLAVRHLHAHRVAADVVRLESGRHRAHGAVLTRSGGVAQHHAAAVPQVRVCRGRGMAHIGRQGYRIGILTERGHRIDNLQHGHIVHIHPQGVAVDTLEIVLKGELHHLVNTLGVPRGVNGVLVLVGTAAALVFAERPSVAVCGVVLRRRSHQVQHIVIQRADSTNRRRVLTVVDRDDRLVVRTHHDRVLSLGFHPVGTLILHETTESVSARHSGIERRIVCGTRGGTLGILPSTIIRTHLPLVGVLRLAFRRRGAARCGTTVNRQHVTSVTNGSAVLTTAIDGAGVELRIDRQHPLTGTLLRRGVAQTVMHKACEPVLARRVCVRGNIRCVGGLVGVGIFDEMTVMPPRVGVLSVTT